MVFAEMIERFGLGQDPTQSENFPKNVVHKVWNPETAFIPKADDAILELKNKVQKTLEEVRLSGKEDPKLQRYLERLEAVLPNQSAEISS